jgi:hypothetical protein
MDCVDLFLYGENDERISGTYDKCKNFKKYMIKP